MVGLGFLGKFFYSLSSTGMELAYTIVGEGNVVSVMAMDPI